MAAEDQLSRGVVDLGRRVSLLERHAKSARPRDVEAGLLRPMSAWVEDQER